MKIRSIKVKPATNPKRRHTKISVFSGRAVKGNAWQVADFRKACLSKVLQRIGVAVGFPVSWNKLCGCSCGCSPGFDVKNGKALDVFVQLW
jgi:hypothetical protein